MSQSYRFPFGEPVRKVEQGDRAPKDVFVLGVYASAVHARWIGPDGAQWVSALAVASEPEIFWTGGGAAEIVAGIDVPAAMGSLAAAAPKRNGSSGRALDDLYLAALGLRRSDVWLCDLLPESRANDLQRKAIETHYRPFVEQGIAPPANVPPTPMSGFVTPDRADEIEAEIRSSQAHTLITLGNQPIKDFVARYGPAPLLRDHEEYGKPRTIRIAGRVLNWVALVHPRQAAGLGFHHPVWRRRHKKWVEAGPEVPDAPPAPKASVPPGAVADSDGAGRGGPGHPPGEEGECIHGLLPVTCAECNRDPGLPRDVVITEQGKVFHRNESCPALQEGQAKVRRRGRTPSEPRWVPLSEARAELRAPCSVCFSDYYREHLAGHAGDGSAGAAVADASSGLPPSVDDAGVHEGSDPGRARRVELLLPPHIHDLAIGLAARAGKPVNEVVADLIERESGCGGDDPRRR